MTTHTGIVKWFSARLGYGYIEPPAALRAELMLEPEKDLFVHNSGLIGQFPKPVLFEGQRVFFNVEMGLKGPRAFNVAPQQAVRSPEHVRD